MAKKIKKIKVIKPKIKEVKENINPRIKKPLIEKRNETNDSETNGKLNLEEKILKKENKDIFSGIRQIKITPLETDFSRKKSAENYTEEISKVYDTRENSSIGSVYQILSEQKESERDYYQQQMLRQPTATTNLNLTPLVREINLDEERKILLRENSEQIERTRNIRYRNDTLKEKRKKNFPFEN